MAATEMVEVASRGCDVERADLAKVETSLAAVLAPVAASEDSCAHVTAHQEVSVKLVAEELKTLAVARQVWTYLLFQVTSFTGAHTAVDPKRFDVHDHRREREIVRDVQEKLRCLLGGSDSWLPIWDASRSALCASRVGKSVVAWVSLSTYCPTPVSLVLRSLVQQGAV